MADKNHAQTSMLQSLKPSCRLDLKFELLAWGAQLMGAHFAQLTKHCIVGTACSPATFLLLKYDSHGGTAKANRYKATR